MMSDVDYVNRLIRKLRARAAPVGSLSVFWDVIFDLEALRDGRETILPENELIPEAEACLAPPKKGKHHIIKG